MLPIYIIKLSQAKEVTETALKTTPYNAVAYGVLVAILIIAVIFIWREYKQSIRRHREYVDKAAGIIQMVENKLDYIEDLERETSELKGEVSDLKERVGQLSEYINLMRSNESN